jgi:hypothetical protein
MRCWDGQQWAPQVLPPAPPAKKKSKAAVYVIATLAGVMVLGGVLVALLFASLFRSFEPVLEVAGQELGEYIDGQQTVDAHLRAVRDGDRVAFAAVWCADPSGGEGPDDQRTRLNEAKRTHGPITEVTETEFELTPPVGHLTYDVTYGATIQHWQATLRMDAAGWRVCSARPVANP